MSENASASTPFYKNPMIIGAGIFFIVMIVVIVVFARGGNSSTLVPTPSAPSAAAPSSMTPATEASCKSFVDAKTCPASSATPVSAASCKSFVDAKTCPASSGGATAASCKSFVDAKTCPAASMTPATAATCSSFVKAEAAKYQPEAYYSDSWCKKKYASLSTVSLLCTKQMKYMDGIKTSVSNVFSTVNTNYLKRVTTTVSSTSQSVATEFFMKTQAGLTVNSADVAESVCVTANKYVVPEKNVSLYANSAQGSTTATKYPKFHTDVTNINAVLKKITAVADVTRQNLTNEIAMKLVNVMYMDSVWTKAYTSADGKKVYYKINPAVLANELDKAVKADPASEYKQACVN